jgi:hypothetical protein
MRKGVKKVQPNPLEKVQPNAPLEKVQPNKDFREDGLNKHSIVCFFVSLNYFQNNLKLALKGLNPFQRIWLNLFQRCIWLHLF